MPILRVDSMGRLYESSPDRADGLGYNGHPEVVSVTDLTLGSVHLKQQAAHRRNVMGERSAVQQQAAIDAFNKNKRQQKRVQAKVRTCEAHGRAVAGVVRIRGFV